MGYRILIVDDNEDVLAVLESLLVYAGYEPQLARRGREALDYLEQGGKPDLVFLDYMLPDLASTTIARRIRERLPSVPIVIVSGVDDVLIPEATAFIRKPFPFDRIESVVRSFLRIRDAAPTIDEPAGPR